MNKGQREGSKEDGMLLFKMFTAQRVTMYSICVHMYVSDPGIAELCCISVNFPYSPCFCGAPDFAY